MLADSYKRPENGVGMRKSADPVGYTAVRRRTKRTPSAESSICSDLSNLISGCFLKVCVDYESPSARTAKLRQTNTTVRHARQVENHVPCI